MMRGYLRSRRAVLAVLVSLVIGIGSVLVGARTVQLTPGEAPLLVPLAYLMAAFVPAVLVASLASPVPQIDAGDVGPLKRARQGHLVMVVLVSLAVNVTAGGLVGLASEWSWFEAAMAARACLMWLGVCLIAARVLREPLAWVGAVVVAVPMTLTGYSGGEPQAWNWAMAPVYSWPAWVLSGVVFVVGMVGFCVRRVNVAQTMACGCHDPSVRRMSRCHGGAVCRRSGMRHDGEVRRAKMGR